VISALPAVKQIGRSGVVRAIVPAFSRCYRSTAPGPVAQWSELAAHNRLVAGSSPAGPTNKINNLVVILVTGANFRASYLVLGWSGADEFGEGRDCGTR
jgi:hypothetical protein